MNTCEGCKFFEVTPGSMILMGTKSGVCHRFPPQGFAVVTGMSGQMGIMFRPPEVQPDNWCGEFEASKETYVVDPGDGRWTYSVQDPGSDN